MLNPGEPVSIRSYLYGLDYGDGGLAVAGLRQKLGAIYSKHIDINVILVGVQTLQSLVYPIESTSISSPYGKIPAVVQRGFAFRLAAVLQGLEGILVSRLGVHLGRIKLLPIDNSQLPAKYMFVNESDYFKAFEAQFSKFPGLYKLLVNSTADNVGFLGFDSSLMSFTICIDPSLYTAGRAYYIGHSPIAIQFGTGMNGSAPWSASHLSTILAHEVGHALGLYHPDQDPGGPNKVQFNCGPGNLVKFPTYESCLANNLMNGGSPVGADQLTSAQKATALKSVYILDGCKNG